ncbi:MAG: PDZ domain-containing protein [Betaproteobacteria bacterium]|nr:PDZ domain-containing protein [Betaproteobacteria bacterium]
MRPTHSLFVAPLFFGLYPAIAPAQGISDVSVEPRAISANQPVRITISSKADAAPCGLEINFGDNNTRTIRGDKFPVVIEHSYQQDGLYAISVAGRQITRGLKSLSPCEGAKSVALQVGVAASAAAAPTPSPSALQGVTLLGATLEVLDQVSARKLSFPSEQYPSALIVRSLSAGSAAAISGLQVGDVVTHVNDQALTPTAAKEAGEAHARGQQVKVTYFRKAQWFAQVVLPQKSAPLIPANPNQRSTPNEPLSPTNAQPAQQSQPMDTSFELVNGSSSVIFSVYISSATEKNWGRDRLGFAGTISSNNKRKFSPDSAGGCTFDIRVQYENKSVEDLRAVDLCQRKQIIFTGSGAVAAATSSQSQGSSGAGQSPRLGFGYTPIDQTAAQRLRFPIDQYTGLLVDSVNPGGIAASAGLVPSDVLTHINDQAANAQTIEEARNLIAQGREVKTTFFRSGQFYNAVFSPQPAGASSSSARPAETAGNELAKNLNDLAKAFEDLGRAFEGRSSRSTQPAAQQNSTSSTSPAQLGGLPPASVNPASCRQGTFMEPREFTQPEILGRPRGERAQMCFYRMEGSRAEYLNFFATGHFYHTSISGSGGFASSGAVYGTVRGTYAFQSGGVLVTRIGYQGTGVSQTNRGAGTQRELDVSGQSRLENEVTLQNCQKITYRDEVKRVQYDRTSSHPSSLIVGGVRWERYSMECPAWRGWATD